MPIDPETVPGALSLSVIAAIIVAMLGWIVKPIRRWLIERLVRAVAGLQTIANRLLGNEVVHIFADRKSLDRHLLRDFKRTSRVFMMTGRGTQIQSEPPFTFLFIERNPVTQPIDIRVVLPVAEVGPGQVDWTSVNELSLRAVDAAYGEGTLSKQIEAAAGVFRAYKARGKLEDIRHANIPHFARIIITDSGVYLTPYNEERLSLQNKVLKFRRGGELAKLWERLFGLLWANPAG